MITNGQNFLMATVVLGWLSASPVPVLAQADQAEVEALRAELKAARALIESLSARVDALQASQSPAKSDTPPAEQQSVADRSSIKAAAANAQTLGTVTVNGVKGVDIGSIPPGPLGSAHSGQRPDNDPRVAIAFQLSAASSSGAAAIKLSQTRDRPTTTLSDDMFMAVSDTIAITASSPASTGGSTYIATLNSLANGFSMRFDFTRFRAPLPAAAAAASLREIRQRAIEKCLQAKIDKPGDYSPDCTIRVDNTFRQKYMSPEDIIADESGYARASIQRAQGFGIGAEIGHQVFNIRNPTTFARSNVNRVPWNIGGTFTAFPDDASAIVLAADYQEGFKARTSQTVCPASQSGTSERCITGALGGPDRIRKAILSGEFRHIMSFGETALIPKLGIAPKVQFDVKRNDFAFDVPIYFVPDAAGKLLGGIRFGYKSDDDIFLAGVFVGSTFKLFD